jgi:putative tryptophan/tyrosine transport system substrate-binding protein
MRRRNFIAGLASTTAAWPVAARAQQPERVRRIGVLMMYEESNLESQVWLTAFREALVKLSWTEGHNIKFEYRWAGTDPDRIQKAAEELIALQPDLILSGGSPSTASLLHQTHTIPLVFPNLVDPVGQGFAASLARPGGNATGLVNLEPSMAGKWLDLLKEVMPHLRRYLWIRF